MNDKKAKSKKQRELELWDLINELEAEKEAEKPKKDCKCDCK